MVTQYTTNDGRINIGSWLFAAKSMMHAQWVLDWMDGSPSASGRHP